MRVLVCDDDRSTRLLFARVLTKDFGCEVVGCGDGVEALQILGREPFSFVVLDLSMPRIDGAEVLQLIRTTTTGSAAAKKAPSGRCCSSAYPITSSSRHGSTSSSRNLPD